MLNNNNSNNKYNNSNKYLAADRVDEDQEAAWAFGQIQPYVAVDSVRPHFGLDGRVALEVDGAIPALR